MPDSRPLLDLQAESGVGDCRRRFLSDSVPIQSDPFAHQSAYTHATAAHRLIKPKGYIPVDCRQLAPALCFLIAMLSYIVSGLSSLATAPTATSTVGAFLIPDNAQCVRANRHADYISVELNVGTPFNLLNIMVRFDRVVSREPSPSTLRLFSNRVVESDTVSCTESMCADVALLQTDGPTGAMKRVAVQFEYTNPTNEAAKGGIAATLGMDGELVMASGFDYYLTATHFCWDKLGDAEAVLSKAIQTSTNPVNASLNKTTYTLYSQASQLVWSETLRNTPAGLAHYLGRCINTPSGDVGATALFPAAAADEATWLGFGSNRPYESSPDGVEDRRVVVEVGTDCASSYVGYHRAYSLYKLDCQSVYTPCETHPSVPIRRVASDELRILTIGENAYVWTYPSTRLLGLPRLEDATEAVLLSILKLVLMTLVAAIVWIRAAKSTSSHDMLFMFCVRTAHCHPTKDTPLSKAVVWEDAFIGLAAIAARIGVASWRLETLSSDNQTRVAWAQLAVSILSFMQWFTRYFILKRQCETPLTKLGGSTALCDASIAVMLAFAEPPLLVSSVGRFDPTARLLTALLLTIVTLQRCLYASACCGLLWAVARHDKKISNYNNHGVWLPGHEGGFWLKFFAKDDDEPRFSYEYEYILLAAAVSWMLQAASVGILLSDVFAVPLAHSSARSFEGDWLPIAYSFFLAITVASMPELVKTSEKIAEAKIDL